MACFELVIPKMGESVAEATIVKWVKNVGDKVSNEDVVLDIATDKIDSEIYSPVSGTITQILFLENAIAKVGATVAIIETEQVDNKAYS